MDVYTERKKSKSFLMTFVRDPTPRTLSLYNYFFIDRQLGERMLTAQKEGLTKEEAIQTIRRWNNQWIATSGKTSDATTTSTSISEGKVKVRLYEPTGLS